MDSGDLSALWLSLKVAGLCTVLLLGPAIACGWLLARKQFPGKTIVEGLIHLPLVLPPVVTGYLLLIVLGSRGLLGKWLEKTTGLEVAFSIWAAILASMVMAFPLMVRSIRLAMELVDPGLEQASRTLGSSPARTFWRITLPLSAPGLLTGCVLAFARSLGEFGATITFAGNIKGETQTLPLAIFSSLQIPGGETRTLHLVVLAIMLSMGALIISQFLAQRIHKRCMGID
ncbi:MAG: molybdate ABC transporter permease subunit [Candidatus Sumerlaeia bacterium]